MTLYQRENARALYQKYPRHYSWVTTFNSKGLFEPGWAKRTIELLKEDFENGAIGVKIWKNFGMEILNPKGEYVLIDDPVLKPIFEFISREEKTLLAHIGEPIHAWMPTYTTEEGIPRNYWANRPEYSFYDKPDKPSYSDIISAVEVNHDGEYLATGDKGGRVVLFERNNTGQVRHRLLSAAIASFHRPVVVCLMSSVKCGIIHRAWVMHAHIMHQSCVSTAPPCPMPPWHVTDDDVYASAARMLVTCDGGGIREARMSFVSSRSFKATR